MGAMMPPVNVYVLAGHDGLLFDSGYGRKPILEHLGKEIRRIEETVKSRGAPFKITRALPSHSHPDHVSGLLYLYKHFGILPLLTEKMAANLAPENGRNPSIAYDKYDVSLWKKIMMRLYCNCIQPALLGTTPVGPAYKIIGENCSLEINGEQWEVMPAPGHCDDHIFLYSRERGILFSGDNIMRSITTWLGPPSSNVTDYKKTLERALALEHLELILSAHGSPITNPKERIQELLAHREQRAREVFYAVEKSGRRGITISGITRMLYNGKKSRKRNIADGWIILTLEELRENGLVKKAGKRYILAG